MKITVHIEIAADPETVWKALTDPAELVRWFPFEAKVTPGKGGWIWLSWGEPVVAKWRIELWHPNRHLCVKEVETLGASIERDNNPTPPLQTTKPDRSRIIDYFLDRKNRKTVLQLVHSGFNSSSPADAEFMQAVTSGWEYELRSLRHYLERHLGQHRRVALVSFISSSSRQEVWDLLMGSHGLLRAGSLNNPLEGERYVIRTSFGEELNGVIQIYDPPLQFAATVVNMNDALFRLKLAKTATGDVEVNISLSAYGLSEAAVQMFEQRWGSFEKAARQALLT